MNEGILLLLVGSSGSGKNTIINHLTKEHKDVKFLVSHTTREMRPGERDGVTYYYVSKQEFEKLLENNEFIENAITHKGFYGISRKAIESSMKKDTVVVKDVSISGLIACRRELKNEARCVAIFLTEAKSILRKRLINRGEKNYRLRLKIYAREQSQMGVCDYIIKNTVLEDTINKTLAILRHTKQDIKLIPHKQFKSVNARRLNKYVDKLSRGETLSPIKVGLCDDKIILLSKPEKYLAELVYGKPCPKRFKNRPVKLNKKDYDLSSWHETIDKLVFNEKQ